MVLPAMLAVLPGLLRDLADDDVELVSIEVLRPTLDDVFLTMTGRSLRDAEGASSPIRDTEEAAA